MDKKLQTALDKWQAIQPISPRDRERLSRRFTVEFNYNSNHIEGNTLTYAQTEILLLFGKIVGEATVRDVLEMTAVRKLVNQLIEKNYVEKNEKDSSWRIIITPSR